MSTRIDDEVGTMDKKYLIVGLLDDKRKLIAQLLADKLSFIYLNIDELIDYQLVNKKNLALAGRDYFDKIQYSCIRQATDCVNTVATLSTELYLYADYAQILSSFCVIFVNFAKNDILSNISTYPQERRQEIENRLAVHDELTSSMRQYADHEIQYTTDKHLIDEILLRIGG